MKDRIVALRRQYPDMSYARIAQIVGCGLGTVRRISARHAPKRTPRQAAYHDLKARNPDWTDYRIAKELGCNPTTITAIVSRSRMSGGATSDQRRSQSVS